MIFGAKDVTGLVVREASGTVLVPSTIASLVDESNVPEIVIAGVPREISMISMAMLLGYTVTRSPRLVKIDLLAMISLTIDALFGGAGTANAKVDEATANPLEASEMIVSSFVTTRPEIESVASSIKAAKEPRRVRVSPSAVRMLCDMPNLSDPALAMGMVEVLIAKREAELRK